MSEEHVAIELRNVSEGPNITGPQLRPVQLYQSLGLTSHGSKLIRVLHLDSDEGNPEAPLKGALEVISLETSPQFAALSYVWGNYANPRHTISCNDCAIEITENCYWACRSLRSLNSTSALWIDAICINQDDEVEKAHQITLMEDVYTWAQPVYIWLGRGDESSDRAISSLSRLSKNQLRYIGIPWYDGSEPKTLSQDQQAFRRRVKNIRLRRMEDWDDTAPLEIDNESWHNAHEHPDLLKFLKQEWLERAWTFQEIILASNPVVISGSKTIDWADFSLGLGALRYDSSMNRTLTFSKWRALFKLWVLVLRPLQWNGTRIRDLPLDQDWSVKKYQNVYGDFETIWRQIQIRWFIQFFAIYLPFITGMALIMYFDHRDITPLRWILIPTALAMVWGLFRILKGRGEPNPFPGDNDVGNDESIAVALVRALRTRHASNSKDRAFAIYGILRRLGVCPAPPDYRKSLGQIFQGLYLCLLNKFPALINLLVDAGMGQLEAPSWVPAWDTVGQKVWLPSEYIYQPLEYGQVEKPQFRILNQGLEIRVEWKGTISYGSGQILRRVRSHLTGDSLSDSLRLPLMALVLHRWLTVIWRHPLAPRRYGNLYDTIWGAILGCRVEFPSVEARRLDPEAEKFDKWYYTMQYHFPPIPSYVDVSNSITLQLIEAFLAQNDVARDFIDGCCGEIDGKRGFIFSPEVGAGTGPLECIPGDRIAYVAGVMAPLVLRKAEGTADNFLLVGPAFVDILMDKNVAGDQEDGSLEPIVLV